MNDEELGLNPERNNPEAPIAYAPGERPEGLPEKFTTMDEFVNAYNEMGKKIREKFNLPEGYESPEQLLEEFTQLKQKIQPPESYEIELPEGVRELSEDDVKFFKELGLNNEQAQKLINYVIETVSPILGETIINLEKERLGRTWSLDPESSFFSDRLLAIKDWADKNLSPSIVQDLSRSAYGINAMYKMMQAGYEKQQVTGQTAEATFSMKDIQELINDDRYWTNAAFRQEVERKIQQLYKM